MLKLNGLSGASDPKVLEWAASQDRVLLSHDVATMIGFAFERVRQGLVMPGLVQVDLTASAERIIQDILLLAQCSHEGEWEGQVLYLPFP